MTIQDKVLVYGAGGVQGGAVARKLVQEGHVVHTIVRNADKAAELQKSGISAFVGDLSDENSLAQAHEGVNKVFLLLPVDYNLERTRDFIRNTVDAARKAKVELLVINQSLVVPDEVTVVTAIEIKRELAAYVLQSGIPYIILQPTLYMENFFVPGVVANSTVAYPVPAELPIAWISIEDAADYGIYALNHPELAGQTFHIAGPESYTGNQLAEQFSAALGQEIQFFSLPVGAFQEAVTPVLGTENAAGLAGLYRWIGSNTSSLPEPQQLDTELRKNIPGTTLKDWVKQSVQQGFFG